MTHIAIQEALDGKAVDWMEQVSDEQYGIEPATFQRRVKSRQATANQEEIMRATVMYGAGDVRIETVPDAGHRRAHRRARARHPRLHLRQRPVALQRHGAAARPAAAWATRRSASSRTSAPTSARSSAATSSSCRSPSPTAPASSATKDCTPRASTAGSSARRQVAGAQAEAVRVPQADGTLFVLPVGEDDALMPSLLTLSDVMGTGHHAAVVAEVAPGQNGRRRRRRRRRPVRRHRRASGSAPSRSSSSAAIPTGSRSRGSSARPTSSASAATRRSSACAS